MMEVYMYRKIINKIFGLLYIFQISSGLAAKDSLVNSEVAKLCILGKLIFDLSLFYDQSSIFMRVDIFESKIFLINEEGIFFLKGVYLAINSLQNYLN